MARLPRYILAGQPQHVFQRGNNRQAIFGVDGDYIFYLENLQMAAEKHGCAIHSYVLMTNNVHLLLTPQQEDGIGRLMQMLGRYYVQYYNYSCQRTGTLLEWRYKATLIDTDQYLLACIRYIELNPVRANNMAGHPSEYPWPSYRCNALSDGNGLITPHPEYQRLGKSGIERQAAYRQPFRTRKLSAKPGIAHSDPIDQSLSSPRNRRKVSDARSCTTKDIHVPAY